MLVTFTTDVFADITMFEKDAHTMLKMMGHSGTIPSAILAADVPAALNRLTAAINSENASLRVDVSPSFICLRFSMTAAINSENASLRVDEDKEEDENANEPVVSLANRALPLINLLTAAAKEGCNVMWK